MKIKKPSIGFWLVTASFLLSIVAFVLYFMTYSALGYNQEYWVIAMMIFAFWSFACLLVNGILVGNKPFFMDVFYALATFALVFATIKFITPCLSPIGIYFTVHNMGDVEANAIGVPRAIAGVVLYLLAIVCVVVASFMNLSKKEAVND